MYENAFDAKIKKYKAMKKDIREVVNAAADDAKLVAMERSPHKGDSGTGLTTGNLASHWKSEVTWSKDGEHFTFSLTNDVPYAAYVNDGHRMDQHFVPWLRIDPSGNLRREKPMAGEQLFGIIVGTKTHYVDPVPMVEPASEEFIRSYKEGLEKLIKKYNNE